MALAKSLSERGRDLISKVTSAGSRFTDPETLAKLSLYPVQKKAKEKAKWTEEEDALLRRAVEKYGENDWAAVMLEVPGRNKLQCSQRWKRTLKPGQTKGPWSPEEDELLVRVMKEEAPGDWQAIARRIPGRNAKQCKERWTLNLNPEINHGPWTPEEDKELVRLHEEIGGKWSVLARRLPRRTEHAIKTRFLSLQKQAAKVRGWSIEEDRIVLKCFMQSPNLDGAAAAMKLLSGRTKRQINQRWSYLRENYPSIDDLATSESALRGTVILRERDLEILIPDPSGHTSIPIPNLPSSLSLSSEMEQDLETERKALARLHKSSTGERNHKKLYKVPTSSSSSTQSKVLLGNELFQLAFESANDMNVVGTLPDQSSMMMMGANGVDQQYNTNQLDFQIGDPAFMMTFAANAPPQQQQQPQQQPSYHRVHSFTMMPPESNLVKRNSSFSEMLGLAFADTHLTESAQPRHDLKNFPSSGLAAASRMKAANSASPPPNSLHQKKRSSEYTISADFNATNLGSYPSFDTQGSFSRNLVSFDSEGKGSFAGSGRQLVLDYRTSSPAFPRHVSSLTDDSRGGSVRQNSLTRNFAANAFTTSFQENLFDAPL